MIGRRRSRRVRGTRRPRSGAAWWIRLILSVLLFAVSLLAVVPAETTALWIASIAVMGWGYIIAVAALLLLLGPPRRGQRAALATVINLVTVVLALSPFLRAVPVARALPARVAVFGDTTPRGGPSAPPRAQPLSLRRWLTPVGAPQVAITTERYASRPGGDLAVDMYRRTSSSAAAPLVLMVHGGSWSGGTRRDLPALNSYLAARGYVVASPEYRLAPSHPFPAARDDIRAALAYLRANATRLGIDPARVVLMGRSAGGEIALLVAYTTPDAGIRGAVGYYSPTDLRYGYDHPSNPAVLNSTRVLEQYLAGTPRTMPAQYDSASPISFASTAVPTLLLHGRRDELVSVHQSVRLDSALSLAGKQHLLVELPWATHGCDYNFVDACGQLGTFALERFLAAVTR